MECGCVSLWHLTASSSPGFGSNRTSDICPEPPGSMEDVVWLYKTTLYLVIN